MNIYALSKPPNDEREYNEICNILVDDVTEYLNQIGYQWLSIAMYHSAIPCQLK